MKAADFRKTITYFFTTVSLIGMVTTGDAAQSGKSLSFITGPMATDNYIVSVSQALLISKKTGIQVIVQPAQGVKAIPSLLESGDGELATLSGLGSYWAYTGAGDYSKPFKFIRVLQSGNIIYFALITREDTGIKTYADLRGKKVTIVPTALVLSEVLEAGLLAYGLNPAKDVTILKAEDTPTALRDLVQKRTDVVSCALGGSKMAELASKTKIVVLPFAAEKAPFLQKKLPAMFTAVTPSDLSGVEAGIPVVATQMLFIARADVIDDLIYQMVKTLIGNYNELKAVNPVMAEWKPEAAVREIPIPYHPGAIKYYKEKGLWSRKMDQLQQKLLEK